MLQRIPGSFRPDLRIQHRALYTYHRGHIETDTHGPLSRSNSYSSFFIVINARCQRPLGEELPAAFPPPRYLIVIPLKIFCCQIFVYEAAYSSHSVRRVACRPATRRYAFRLKPTTRLVSRHAYFFFFSIHWPLPLRLSVYTYVCTYTRVPSFLRIGTSARQGYGPYVANESVSFMSDVRKVRANERWTRLLHAVIYVIYAY